MLLYPTQLIFAPPSSPLLCFNLENDGIFVFLFQLGDIIVAIDKQEINTEVDLFKVLESRQPGDEIAITAERVTEDGTETLFLKIQLAEAPQPVVQAS
ncbi:unnamed protein product [Ectocarpus sp. 12 AP-2014]